MNQLTSKYVIVLLFGMSITFSLSAQSFKDVYPIRSYNNSLLLSLEENSNSQLTLGDYGSIAYSSGNFDSATDRYLYQGQEYSKNLGLHLYPYRAYSATQKRFFSPDPKSQYFSPYLFVAADPINLIDFDGQMGKVLFLYQEDHRLPDSKGTTLSDLMTDVQDAYYVPMSDFINGDVGDLKDWNGNVFLKGHMGDEAGHELTVEQTNVEDMIKTDHMGAVEEPMPKVGYQVKFDAREMGQMLRDFSDSRQVPIKNIVAGGCQGGVAAEGIYDGFISVPAKKGVAASRSLSVSGLRKGNRAMFAGEKSVKKLGYKGPYFKTRFHTRPEESLERRRVAGTPGNKRLVGFAKSQGGKDSDLKYVEGEQLSEFINGRVPENMEEEFVTFRGLY